MSEPSELQESTNQPESHESQDSTNQPEPTNQPESSELQQEATNAEDAEDVENDEEDEEMLFERQQLNVKLMWSFAIKIVDTFRARPENTGFFLDVLDATMGLSDSLENIECLTIEYMSDNIKHTQSFEHIHANHIIENLKVPTDDQSRITYYLSKVVNKLGYDLRYPLDFNITVYTENYSYFCDSMINGKLHITKFRLPMEIL